MDLLLAFLMLLFALNPAGKASLFISELRLVDPVRRRRSAVRELLIALLLIGGFLAAATLLLQQVQGSLILVAGAVVLAAMGLRRIFLGTGVVRFAAAQGDAILFPLAFPYIAGPAVLAAELVLAARAPARWPVWAPASYLAWFASAFILYHSQRVQASLGARGVRLVELVSGLGLLLLAGEIFAFGSLGAPGLIAVR